MLIVNILRYQEIKSHVQDNQANKLTEPASGNCTKSNRVPLNSAQ